MKRVIRVLVIAVLVLLVTLPVAAREYGTIAGRTPVELLPGAVFDPDIPTQEEITGVRPGRRPLRHEELMRFLEALAEASPRALLQRYAESHEGRQLVVLAVSEPSTVAELDAFREAHLRRMDPRGRDADGDREVLAGAKAVAWMAYGIHGDELSSSDAAATLAYWLVAGEDDRARELRRSLVVLIDPMENPDGRERFLAQTASFAHKVPNPDQEDLSHTTVWPWGRGNHYLFDLNRDWFTMVHPESRRSEMIASWIPQIVLDAHEMGSDDSYLFTPPRRPFNPLLPGHEKKWWDRFAAEQARALDARGYGYYTGEWNEEFFPGYGSSWAAYFGAIGILYEMSGTEGTFVRRHDGTYRTFVEAVEHQLASSVANLETLAAGRGELLADFVASRRRAVASPKGPARAWILPRGDRPQRTDSLAHLLRRQGLEVLRLEAEQTVDGLRDIRTGRVSRLELPVGSWMVPLDQPNSPLASVLLDPHVPMSADYLREERESIERGEGSRLYDATAWSLPLLFGVEAHWSERRPRGSWSATSAPGEVKGEVSAAAGSEMPFAYLLDATGDHSMAALAALLQGELKVRVAEKPFRVAGRSYGRGAVLVPREGNPDDLADRLGKIAERWAVSFHATPTADSEEGPDLGGSHFLPLQLPRIGIVTGMPISTSDYGSLWYVFDERIGLRFNGIDISFLPRLDLSRYNVLVFPPAQGGPAGYRRILGESGLEALRLWIEGGGTAIGIGSGAAFLADVGTELSSTRLRSQALDDYPPLVLGAPAGSAEAVAPRRAVGLRAASPVSASPSATLDQSPMLGSGARPFAPEVAPSKLEPVPLKEWLEATLPAGREEPSSEDIEKADARLRSLGPRGALVRVEVDSRHWMGWGLDSQMTVFLRASDTLVADAEVQVPAGFGAPEELHRGGLLWPEAAGRLAHTAFATREGRGEGQIILFLDHPTYRAWLWDSQRMFLNAVLYGPGLGTGWTTPW